jgi:hypothetical protein
VQYWESKILCQGDYSGPEKVHWDRRKREPDTTGVRVFSCYYCPLASDFSGRYARGDHFCHGCTIDGETNLACTCEPAIRDQDGSPKKKSKISLGM